jgi:hypothetical protein
VTKALGDVLAGDGDTTVRRLALQRVLPCPCRGLKVIATTWPGYSRVLYDDVIMMTSS